MNSYSYIVWSQPRDELARDIITLDGVDVDPADEAQREDIVSWMSELAGSDNRRELSGGGYLVRGVFGAVAEVPVQSPYENFAPTVSVGVSSSRGGAPDLTETVSAEVVRVAELAGHTADAHLVRPVIRQLLVGDPVADLLRRLRRLLAWVAAWCRRWAEEPR